MVHCLSDYRLANFIPVDYVKSKNIEAKIFQVCIIYTVHLQVSSKRVANLLTCLQRTYANVVLI